MKLELWRPLLDLEKEWDSIFRFPRFVSEGFEFPFRPTWCGSHRTRPRGLSDSSS